MTYLTQEQRDCIEAAALELIAADKADEFPVDSESGLRLSAAADIFTLLLDPESVLALLEEIKHLRHVLSAISQTLP